MGSPGVDSSAQQAQIDANAETLALIERQTQRGARDVSKLFGSAQENLLAGNQGALDIFGQSAPQQLSALQQGNMGAQQQLLAGLPQQQAALLGLPADLSALQPRGVNVNTGFMQQQLPQFSTPQQALTLTPEDQAQEQGFAIDAALAGLPGVQRGGSIKDFGRSVNARVKALSALSPEAWQAGIDRGESGSELDMARSQQDVFAKAWGRF